MDYVDINENYRLYLELHPWESTFGKFNSRVWSTRYSRFLKPVFSNGYERYRMPEPEERYAHRLLIKYFKPEEWDSTLTVNHINMNKRDNSLSNLEMVSYSENTLHMYDNNGHPLTNRLFTTDQVRDMRQRYEDGEKIIDIARCYYSSTKTCTELKKEYQSIYRVVTRKHYDWVE